MRLLVLNVDRDDDLGRKTQIPGPVLGRDAMVHAATQLVLADPEEADANGMFAAVHEYDEILQKKADYGAEAVFVAAVTGHINEGLYADNAIAQQFDQLMAQTQCDAVILVSDGGEDEHVLPILKTRVKVNGIRRVVIKQSKNLEGMFFLFSRLLHDEKLQRRFFIPLALFLMAAGAAVIFERPGLFIGIGLFLAAAYIMFQVFEWGPPLAQQIRSGKLSLFAAVAAFLVILWGGLLTLKDPALARADSNLHFTLLFAKSIYWWIVAGGLLTIFGRGLDGYVRENVVYARTWELFLYTAGGATAGFGLLQLGERAVYRGAFGLEWLVSIEFLTWAFFGGFLIFTGLIAREFFEHVGPAKARSADEPK